MGIEIQPPGPSQQVGAGAATLNNYNSSTGPGAGASLASIAAGSLTAGTRYQVTVTYFLGGTTASPADDDNLKLIVNGSQVARILYNGAAGIAAEPQSVTLVTAPMAAGQAITVQTVGAGTGTAVYHTSLYATPVGD